MVHPRPKVKLKSLLGQAAQELRQKLCSRISTPTTECQTMLPCSK